MDYIRTLLIFSHIMVFAFAITTLYRSDFQLIFKRPGNAELKQMSNHMLIYLVALWITGLGVIYVDTAFNLDKILASQKLLTKIACVLVLSLNAFVIHYVAFRKLGKEFLTKADMLLMSISGAVSTASWTFAGFLGVAKPLVKHLSLADFMSLYGLVVLTAMAIAIALTPLITRNWTKTGD